MKKPTEQALIKQCLQWLLLKGFWAWRANSGGGLRRGRGGRMVPVVGNPSGTPDILCVLPAHGEFLPGRRHLAGRLCGIEVKTAAGKLRPSQKAWAEGAERKGVLCLVVRSLQELIDALTLEGIQ